MRLWFRLVLALAVVAVIPVTILAWYADRTARDQADELSRSKVEREAQLQAAHLSRWTHDQAQFLEGWARPYRARLDQMDDRYRAALLDAVLIAMPSVRVVAIVNGDGVAVSGPAFGPDALAAGADGQRAQVLVSRAPITEALASNLGVGTPYRPPGAARVSIPVAALATERTAGAPTDEVLFLVAEIELVVLADIAADAGPERADVLLDAQGNLLIGGNHPLVDPSLLRALAQMTNVVGSVSYPTGNPRVIGGIAAVRDTDWTYVVLRPAASLGSAVDRIARNSRILIFFGVAVSLWLGWTLAQQLTGGVEALRASVLAVAEGDYGRRADIDASDEIGELSRAFNHMSARLAVNQREIADQHEEIVKLNEELQDRVERRTRQLTDAQDQLVRSGQLAAVAEVGAGLAHELNNPLAAILGTAQVLRARGGNARDQALLGELEAQAQRCREVVGAMLRFSSGEEVDPRNAPVVDLRDVLDDVTTLVQGPFRQRGLTLQLDMPDTPLRVRVDPLHGSRILAQVLNALRAGLTDGTTLRVAADVTDDEIAVVMAPDYPVAIDEFRRDDWMASGMGLWVARRLLDQLGGRLEQPVQVPWMSGMRAPATEEVTEDPSMPLLQDATWRVVFPRSLS